MAGGMCQCNPGNVFVPVRHDSSNNTHTINWEGKIHPRQLKTVHRFPVNCRINTQIRQRPLSRDMEVGIKELE